MVIDVLLATYNGEKWLPEQLCSLAAQTEPDFRVLMQDDGSHDGTLALLEAWQERDKRFRLVCDASEQRCKGAIGNFWSLLKQSDAAYTALCDQDDVWHKERLACCLTAMKTAELRWGADTPLMIHSDAVVTDEAGKTLHPSFFTHQGWDPEATSLPQLMVQNNVTGCTCLMNAALRKLAARYGEPERMHMHDWFLAMTAAAFGRVVCIRQPLVNYRQHGHNEMGASPKSLPERGVAALSARERGKTRIALTYVNAKAFRDAYREKLSGEAERTVETYLALEHKHKLSRLHGILKGGYRMQSFVTRVGQIVYC